MLIKTNYRLITAALVIVVSQSITLQTNAAEPTIRQQHIQPVVAFSGTCKSSQQVCPGCPNCRSGKIPWASFDDTWIDSWRMPNLGHKLHSLYCRKRRQHERFSDYFKKRFGYFNPTGGCRGGCSPYGGYKIIYATQPRYFDPRDGHIYASPTTGIPVTVPLAPNVRHQWNYSHGIPSSRLTPISTIVPTQRPGNVH